MDFMINIDLKRSGKLIGYNDKILLTGSCFTEHIGNALKGLKFTVLQNPHGILFDPHSVSSSLVSYVQNKKYGEKHFFELNGVWHSWAHHSRFSNTNLQQAVHLANQSQQDAHDFLKTATWLVITLGSSFSYRLTDSAVKTTGFENESSGVANCHRAPAQWFSKYMMATDEIIDELGSALDQLLQFNGKLNVLFTVSPVRHIRDGVVDNNRSKARLIESVHHLAANYPNVFYFPAYELVIDVLRDYRFYDIDLVHPNYMATEFVLEKFTETFIDESAMEILKEIKTIMNAKNHKPFQPATEAHRQFLKTFYERAKAAQAKYPGIGLQDEIDFFSEYKE